MNNRLRASCEILVAVLFLSTLSLLIMPLVEGFFIRKEIESYFKSGVLFSKTASIKYYDQGWFSSEFTVELNGQNGAINYYLANTIFHGPIYLGMLNQARSPLVKAFIDTRVSPVLTGKMRQRPSLFIKSVLLFDGIIEGSIQGSLKGAVPSAQHFVTFDLASGEGIYQYAQNTSELKIDYQCSELRVAYGGEQYIGESVNLSTNYRLHSNEAWFGTFNMTIGAIPRLRNSSPELADAEKILNNLSLQLSHVDNNGEDNHRFSLELQNIKIADMDLNKIALEMNTINTGSSALAFVNDVYELNQLSWPTNFYQALFRLPTWLGAGEIEISRLHAETPAGQFDAWLRLAMPEFEEVAMMDPVFILMALKMNSELSISQSLLHRLYENEAAVMFYRQNPDLAKSLSADSFQQQAALLAREKLKTLIKLKYIEAVVDRYETTIAIDKGDFQVNRQPINPMQVLFFENDDVGLGAPLQTK